MELFFNEHSYTKLLNKAGLKTDGAGGQLKSILVALIICWLPLAIITLIQQNFWTGNFANSFITSFDIQARLLITVPILIFSERVVNSKLGKLLAQFVSSGIVRTEDTERFYQIIGNHEKFMKSRWVDFALFILCYMQVFLILFYTAENTHMLEWGLNKGHESLNFAGLWSTLISKPFVLYLVYSWMLRIVGWGVILYKITRLNLNLFPPHPDLVGGLGFLPYSIRYFSPVAFAFSAIVAGNMADFVLIEGSHVLDFKFIALAYLIFITAMFIIPLLFFVEKLTAAREKSIFENNDYANGIFRELQSKVALKGFNQVNAEDMDSTEFSTVCDMSGVFGNVLNMQTFPFTLKDLLPLWMMAVAPFIFVVFIEFPILEVLKTVLSMLV
jgi:hypothetical protein